MAPRASNYTQTTLCRLAIHVCGRWFPRSLIRTRRRWTAPTPPVQPPLAKSVLGPAIIAITGMQLMSTLDGTIVIVALPRMQADLGLTDAARAG